MILHLLLLACATESVGPGPNTPANDPEAVDMPTETELPPIAHALRTTNGQTAKDSLDGRIDTLYGLIGRLPENQGALQEALSLRASLFGHISDLDRMQAVATDARHQADALMAVHKFDEALALSPHVAASVHLARHHDLNALAAERRAAIDRRPSTNTWTALGDVLLAQGDAATADEAYWQALKHYRNVSPLTVAELQFRRGLAWGEGGKDPVRARALYTDAVKRLPDFVRANVHLAELEWEAGDKKAAIARVRRVAGAQDPEPGGKLATWLDEPEASEWRNKTTKAYDALLAKQSLAFANHAAEYFKAIGDLDRARSLAAEDVANRPTPRAQGLCRELNCGQ